MQVIKYYLRNPAQSREFVVALPQRAVILSVHLQHEEPVLWAYVDVNNPVRDIRFWWLRDGDECPDRGWFHGTLQFFSGNEVFHLFSNQHEPR